MMIWVDYCIVSVLVVSVIVGVIRGFAREVLGLLTWILAICLAVGAGPALAVKLAPHISVPSVRIACAYAILFLAGLLVGGIITTLIVRRLRASALSSTDRTLGAGYGVIRGAVVVALFILVAGTTPAHQDPWWHRSMLLNKFEWLADGIRVLVPPRWLDQLKSAENSADENLQSAPTLTEPASPL